MFALSSLSFDPLGDILSDSSDSTELDMKRRLTRTATINGGTKLYDGGFADGEATLKLNFPYSSNAEAVLKNLVKNHGEIILASRHGCFSGAIETLTYDQRAGQFVVRFLVVQRVN